MHDDDEDEGGNLQFPGRDDFEDADANGFEGADTITCPRCGKQVYEEAQRCHKCGHWIDHRHESRLPRWVIITAIICLIIAVLWALFPTTVHWGP